MNENFPKKIWIFWSQGFLQAPPIVKMCISSWQLRNPDYEILLLDEYSVVDYINVPSYINMERSDFSYAKYADYIRLALLEKYGGVWVDAYTYCLQPLSSWLSNNTSNQIFLFENSFKNRLIASWFIAAIPEHYIIHKWKKEYEDFFKNKYYNIHTRLGNFLIKKLSPYFNRNIQSTTLWLSFIVRKILGIYPYFILHYIFNNLYLKNNQFKETWDKTSKYSAKQIDLQYTQDKEDDYNNYSFLIKHNHLPLLKLSYWGITTLSYYPKYLKLIKKDFQDLKLSKY